MSNKRVLRMLAPLGAALVLLAFFAFGLQTTVSAEPTAPARTCPWFGQSDSPNPTWEDWGGWYIINGLPGPVGSEIEMRNTLGNPVSCYRTSIPGGWGVSRITNGSQGFYVGESIIVFADGWPAQSGFHNYAGDKLGHSMTVTLDIPQFSLTVEPEFISETVSVGDFRMIEVTVTNATQYPAYFSSAVADGWNWAGCVWPTTNTQNVLKPRASMVLLFSVNGTTCAATGGFNSAVIFAETHPVVAGSPASITLPIQVAVIAEMTPTPTMVKPTDTPLPPPVEPTTTPIQPTDTPLPPPVESTPTPTTTPAATPTATPTVTPTATAIPPVASWSLNVDSPGEVDGGQLVTFTMQVKNTGTVTQQGVITLTTALVPFATAPQNSVSPGTIVTTVTTADAQIDTWTFLVPPGLSATFNLTAKTVEMDFNIVFLSTWSWEGPTSQHDGFAALTILGEEDLPWRKIFLPLVGR